MQRFRKLASLLAAAVMGTSCTGAPADPSSSKSECPDGSLLGYDNFGAPFMSTWCTGCHAGGLAEGARQGAPIDVNFDDLGSIRAHRARIEARAAAPGGTMPPAGGPDDQERAELAEWLSCGAPGEPVGGLVGSGGSADTTVGSGTGGSSSVCADESTSDVCASCCDEEAADGYDAFVTALVLHCACSASSGEGGAGPDEPPCRAACDTDEPATDFCPAPGRVSLLEPQVNPSCFGCVGQLGPSAACTQQALRFCQADVGCSDWMTCAAACAQK